MTVFQKGIIALIRAGISGEQVALPEDFRADNLDLFGKKHHISSILLHGALAAGLDSSHPCIRSLYVLSCKELLLYERQKAEAAALKAVLSSANIDYLFLKGSAINHIYPKPEMRVMSDMDLLIRCEQYPEIKQILSGTGYTEQEQSNHEYIWKTPGGLVLEFHKMLIPSYNEDYHSYFGNGWDKALRSEDGSYYYSPEDNFIYLFTHFAKHYRDGGVGIKHLLDLWLFRKHYPDLDLVYVEKEFGKLLLLPFYNNIQKVLDVWFCNKEPDSITNLITNTIIKSGAYGTQNSRVSATVLKTSRNVAKNNIKTKLLLQKLFPSSEVLCVKYKYLIKHKYLLPFAWISRFFTLIIKKPSNIRLHTQAIRLANATSVDDFEQKLRAVGLEFNFKEK